MATIFMNVKNNKMALETLLYVFRNQMDLGKNFISLTIKRKNGIKEQIIGDIDKVFKSDKLQEIEYGDMILLEHSNKIENQLLSDIDSLSTLIDLGKNIKTCCHFIITTDIIYFIIKDCPMVEYTIYQNEIISDKIFGTVGRIFNNMVGKIKPEIGVFTLISITR